MLPKLRRHRREVRVGLLPGLGNLERLELLLRVAYPRVRGGAF